MSTQGVVPVVTICEEEPERVTAQLVPPVKVICPLTWAFLNKAIPPPPTE